jgi:hypothetical protein
MKYNERPTQLEETANAEAMTVFAELIPILNNNRYKLLDKRLGLAQAMAWQENERN